jgi:hypothetical protein
MECLGCNLIETAPRTLNDERTVCSSCPAWRLECEARDVLAKPTLEARREYLAGVEEKRGKAAVEELKAAMKVEWGKRKKAA